MPKAIVSINFFGHNEPSFSSLPAEYAPLNKKFGKAAYRYYIGTSWAGLNVIGKGRLEGCKSPKGKLYFYDYNSALNEPDNKALAQKVLDKINVEIKDKDEDGNALERVFLITGYSAGGVSAMHMARLLKANTFPIFYIGLADAAFQRNESEYLMSTAGFTAKYMKNYYQTKENQPDVSEIHDEVLGFSNFNLNDNVAKESEFHKSAIKVANDRMFDDVKWCLENC